MILRFALILAFLERGTTCDAIGLFWADMEETQEDMYFVSLGGDD